MTSIDNRIVEMQFDDSKFSPGVKTAIEALKNLKDALKGTSGTEAFSDISKAADRVNLNSLDQSVSTISERFSALGIIGVTALMNITNKAVDAGMALAKSLTIDQVAAGFSEYELKMSSVQTILSNAKTADGMAVSLDMVMNKLEELNTYADKTIYSFSDMTNSIGKFTNAGVDLDTAVAAIQGISNEAAVSGANAQEASRAMYNFAQALSSGAVKLIDWKSIENANMATVDFKQQLIDTAVAMGTLEEKEGQYVSTTTDMQGKVSEAFDATSHFNDSLSAQWLTTDVLTTTLSNYAQNVEEMTDKEREEFEEKLRGIGYTEEQIAGIEELGVKAFAAAQDVKTFSQMMDTLKESIGSGWAQTFEYIFGDFEEAKALWTGVNNAINDLIGPISTFRNETFKLWHDLGGRAAIIEGLGNAFGYFGQVFAPIKDAVGAFLPTSEELGNKLYELSERFKNFTANLSVSSETYETLHSIVTSLIRIFRTFGKTIGFVASYIGPAFKSLLGYISPLGPVVAKALESFADFVSELYYVYIGSGALRDQIYEISNEIKGYLTPVVKKVTKALSPFADKIASLIPKLKEFVRGLAGLEGKPLSIENAFHKLVERIKSFIAPFKESTAAIKEMFSNLKFGENIASAFGIISESLSGVLSGNKDSIIGFITDFVSGVAEAIDKVLADFHIGNLVETLLLLFGSVELIGLIKNVKDLFDGVTDVIDNAGGVFESVSDAIGNLGEVLESMSRALNAITILAIAGALYLLAKSLAEVASIDPSRLGAATAAIAALIGALAVAMGVLQGASAIGKIAKPLDAINAVVQGFTLTIQAKMLTGLAVAFLGLAAAIFILAKAVESLGSLDIDTLTKGLVSVVVLLAGLTAAFALLSKVSSGKGMAGIGIGMLGIAAAIYILTKSMKELAGIDSESLLRGGSALAVLAAGVMVMIFVLSKIGRIKGVMRTALAILVLSATMFVLVKAVEKLSEVPVETIVDGATKMIVLVGAIGLILTAMSLLTKGKGMLTSAAAILIVAASLTLIINAVKEVSEMDGNAFRESAQNLLDAVGIIALILAALSVISSVAGGGMVTSAIAIVLVSAALTLVAKALQDVASVDATAMQQALSVMTDAIGMIGLVLLAVGALSIVGGAVVGAGAAILMASASMLLIAAAIKVVASVPADQAQSALIMLAAGLGILLAAGAIASIPMLSQGLIALAAACALIGAGVLLAGAGMMILAMGLKILTTISADDFSSLADALVNLSKGLDSVDWATMTVVGAAAIVLAAGALLLGVAGVILGAGAIVLSVGLGLLSGALALMSNADFSCVDKLNEAMKNAEVGTMLGFSVASLALGASFLILALGVLAISGAMAVLGAVNMFNMLTLSTILSSMDPVAMLAIGAASIVLGAGLLVLGAALVIFGAGMTLLGVGLGLVGEGLVSFMTGMQFASDNFGALVQSIHDNIAAFKDSFNFSELGSMIISTLTGGAYSNVGELGSVALEAITNFASGIASNLGLADEEGHTTIKSVMDAMGIELPSLSDVGKGIIDNIITGISGMVGSLKEKASSVMESAKSAFSGVSFSSIGSNIISGIISGVSNAAGQLLEKMRGLASDALSAAKEKLGIASPSKVFRDEVGRWIPEGIGAGIERYSSVAERAVEGMSTDITDTALNALSQLNNYKSNFGDARFSAVVDADSFANAGANMKFDALFAERSLKSAVDAVNNQNGSFTDANIIAELQALRHDVKGIKAVNYNMSMNGVTLNDESAMARVTEDYLLELSRIGGMNFG